MRETTGSILITALTLGLASVSAPAWADEASPEVLTKGPVHEAFAAPVTFNPEGTPVIVKAPPAPIEEVPPDSKPEGDNVRWISGYWSWDDDRQDYIWVSGVWRAYPPGKTWTSGQWKETSGGWQWVPGYWAAQDQASAPAAAVVTTAPPQTLESGPTSPAPSTEYVWVSGNWMWADRWVWRPGYWMAADPDWVWMPAHWVWTPGGWVFVDGYYDYVIARRGWLFAPVYYGPGWAWAPGYRWRPAVVIGADVLVDHFFVYPRCRAYYFGDYYAVGYTHVGIYPWYSFHMSSYGYDPIYAHAVYYHRADPGWATQVRQNYAYRQQHAEARPPPTMTQQQTLVSRNTSFATQNRLVLAQPVAQFAKAQPRIGAAKPPPRSPVVPRPDPSFQRTRELAHPNDQIHVQPHAGPQGGQQIPHSTVNKPEHIEHNDRPQMIERQQPRPSGTPNTGAPNAGGTKRIERRPQQTPPPAQPPPPQIKKKPQGGHHH